MTTLPDPSLSILSNYIFYKKLHSDSDKRNNSSKLVLRIAQHCNRSNLNVHRKIHLPRTEFQCPSCEYATNFHRDPVHHIRTHTKERPYKCPHPNCESAFTQKGSLTYHSQVHSQMGDKPALKFSCTFCPYKTAVKWSLKTHLVVHSEVKAFSCHLCPYKAKYKSCIKDHVQRVHWKVRPFLCPQPGCQHACKFKYDLTKHMNMHSNFRSFVCSFPQCDYKAKCKDRLNQHLKIHNRKYLDGCTKRNFPATNRNDHHVNKDETLDPSQEPSQTPSPDGKRKILDKETAQYTHVQWSVDWGKIQSQCVESVESQRQKSPRTVIKIENDTGEPFNRN